jgi:hypothetical protein
LSRSLWYFAAGVVVGLLISFLLFTGSRPPRYITPEVEHDSSYSLPLVPADSAYLPDSSRARPIVP